MMNEELRMKNEKGGLAEENRGKKYKM